MTTVITILAFAPHSQGVAAIVNYDFTKVADTNTLIPGGIGTFASFALASDVSAFGAGPSLHNSQVAFTGGVGAGASPASQRGIYTWNAGTLARIADRSTVIPGNPQSRTFANFSNPVIENGQVAFTGNNGGGLYRTNGASLIRIVDTNQTIPGFTSTFTATGPAISNGEIAFRSGPGAGGGSIFKTENGQLVKIMDINTTVPGTTSTFNGAMSYPDIESGQVVFSGTGSPGLPGGIYLGNGSTLTTIVNQDTLIPDGQTPGATYSRNFGSPVISNGQVAFFAATSSGDNGIYFSDGKSVHLVADVLTALPDSIGNLTQFGNAFEDPSFDNGVIAFAAGPGGGGSTQPRGGIYATFGAELGKVIDVEDLLDGKSLAGVFLGQHGLDGDSLAFYARFTDGSEGIYLAKANLAPVPLPAAAWLMLSGLVPMLVVSRRRKSLSS